MTVGRSFTRKQLRTTITLAGNALFEGTNSNVLILENLRQTVAIKSAGAPVLPSAQLQIYGMRQSEMNALTFLSFDPRGIMRNRITVEQNDGRGWTVVFSGDIFEAGPEYQGAPDVFLRVQAMSVYYDTLNPTDPTSYRGKIDVAVVIAGIVARMDNKTFEPNGVSIQIDNPYLPNTLGEQLQTICKHAGIDLYIDGDVIAITNRGQPRGSDIVVINRNSGLESYPTLDTKGVQFTCLFNSGLQFGGRVRIQSDVPKANGDWRIYALDHYLQSETPNGKWHSYVACSEFDRAVFRG